MKQVSRKATREQDPDRSGWSSPLSLRAWSLLHIKAVSAVLDEAVFGDSDGIKRIVHSYLGYAPSGVKLATGSVPGLLRIVDAATGAVEKEVPHESAVFSVAWSP